jgi:hypothetical protein
MLGLDPAQLVQQRVVLLVSDLGIVEDVVAVAVIVELRAQLGGTRRRIGVRRSRGGGAQDSTSSAAGRISRARS